MGRKATAGRAKFIRLSLSKTSLISTKPEMDGQEN
jgi:hypothetical protein